jgi:pantetheine-phosphate adenylyltransferase
VTAGPRTALYTGSFDPPTNGHLHIIGAAGRICGRLVVAVGTHPTKAPLLTIEERIALLRAEAEAVLAGSGCALEVRGFTGLAVDAARAAGAGLILRGLRSGSDLDDEMVMAGMNGAMAPEIQTVFVPASPETRAITSTLVRQIAAMGGDVSAFVPASVRNALMRVRSPAR